MDPTNTGHRAHSLIGAHLESWPDQTEFTLPCIPLTHCVSITIIWKMLGSPIKPAFNLLDAEDGIFRAEVSSVNEGDPSITKTLADIAFNIQDTRFLTPWGKTSTFPLMRGGKCKHIFMFFIFLERNSARKGWTITSCFWYLQHNTRGWGWGWVRDCFVKTNQRAIAMLIFNPIVAQPRFPWLNVWLSNRLESLHTAHL